MASVSAFAYSDAAYVALAVFLVAVGLALAYALVRLGGALANLASLIRGAQGELVPLISETRGTVTRVNAQLDKVDQITDSAVDAADSADTAVRAISVAITRPVQKLSGLAAGIAYGFADLRAHRDWRGALDAGREAAARRERELAEELRAADRDSA